MAQILKTDSNIKKSYWFIGKPILAIGWSLSINIYNNKYNFLKEIKEEKQKHPWTNMKSDVNKPICFFN